MVKLDQSHKYTVNSKQLTNKPKVSFNRTNFPQQYVSYISQLFLPTHYKPILERLPVGNTSLMLSKLLGLYIKEKLNEL